LRSLDDDIPPPPPFPPLPLISLISIFRAPDEAPASSSAFRSNDSRDPRGEKEKRRRGGRREESGRNCVNYPLISASDPPADYAPPPPRMLIPLARLLSDVSETAQPNTGSANVGERREGRGRRGVRARGKRATVAGDKSRRVIYEIGCFNKPPARAQRSATRARERRAAFRNGTVIFIREIYYLQFELNEF